MSDVMYPISLIEGVQIQRVDRTLLDEFEDGSTNVRRYWDAQNFKRRVQVNHSHLTLDEFRYLRTFHSQRSGAYDPFWFRDNVHRGGNMKVRFASPLVEPWSAGARRIQVSLDEVAPIRSLPEFDELATAAGNTPAFWYDANRDRYHKHAGTEFYDTHFFDSQANAAGAALQAGTFPLGDKLAQYQHHAFDGTAWGKSAVNVNISGGGFKPACTLFAICKHGTVASQQIIFSIGQMATASGMGIQINAANEYTPWIGTLNSWSTAAVSNATPNTWRSLAVTWPSASSDGTIFANGASVGTDTNVRSYLPGPVSLGAALDGTLLTTGNVAHVMAFNAVLTLSQIKAVHNLLGYQYGLATVS